MKWMLALAVMAATASAQDDPDRRKNSSALFTDGFRLETEKPVNLEKAVAKYAKAVARAGEEEPAAPNDEAKKAIRSTAAAALVRTGYCYEKMEADKVSDAQAAYGKVAGEYAAVEKWGAIAQEKVALKGVDVYLRQLHGSLQGWRDTPGRSPLDPAIADKKKAAREKIQALDKEAVIGLAWGLGHADEIVRDVAAETLAEVVDGPGIAAVIARLNDANADARAGAGLALQKIFKKFNEASALDRAAEELERDLNIPTDKGKQPYPKRDELREKAKTLATAHRKKAGEIRHNIPDSLATPEVQGALEKIIADEAADPQARLEAAHAAGSIGRISGPLADAILKGIDSKNRNVRQACCRAARAVDPTASADKVKLLERLIVAVTYEPAKYDPETDAEKKGPDWANDEIVRQAAAEALEQLALIKSLPALIEALDDNDASVRNAAHRALREITRRDFGYEADKPMKDRAPAAAAWKKWWDDTEGIVVLVERFWYFQAQWKEFSAVKLFDPALFLREVQSRQWASEDPKADLDRAQRVADNFQKLKNTYVQDAVDVGPAAIDRLLKFIGGETERETLANVPTRWYVAEACARIIEKSGAADGVGKIRDIVASGDSAAKKAGAATSLAFLAKDKTGAGEREALVRGLGAAEMEVREACANALAKIGDEGNAADLVKTAVDPADANVQIASLRALEALKPKGAEIVTAIGEMISHEPPRESNIPSKKSPNPRVREHVCDALGAIGIPSAMQHLFRARRDLIRAVQEAAKLAVKKVYKNDPKACREELEKILTDESLKTDDRIGAARTLGDSEDVAVAKTLVLRIFDRNPPRELKDQDPEVRMVVCQALASLKAKTLTVVERLLEVMRNEEERENVRNAAYEALKAVAGANPADFSGSAPRPKRDEAVKAWLDWFNGEKANLPADPQ